MLSELTQQNTSRFFIYFIYFFLTRSIGSILPDGKHNEEHKSHYKRYATIVTILPINISMLAHKMFVHAVLKDTSLEKSNTLSVMPF